MQWRTRLMAAGVLLSLAIAPSSWAATIVSTFGSTWDPAPWTPPPLAIGSYSLQHTSERRCWPYPRPWNDYSAGLQECGAWVDAWVTGGVAWSFVPPGDVNADGVELALGRIAQSDGNEVTIALHDDTDSLPGAMLRSVTLSGSVPVEFAYGMPLTRAAFASPVALSSGSTYWVVVTTPPSTAVGWFMNGPTSGNTCGGRVGAGMRQWPLGSSAWQPYPEVNMLPTCSAAFRVTGP
jgi:hypothetical protein